MNDAERQISRFASRLAEGLRTKAQSIEDAGDAEGFTDVEVATIETLRAVAKAVEDALPYDED